MPDSNVVMPSIFIIALILVGCGALAGSRRKLGRVYFVALAIVVSLLHLPGLMIFSVEAHGPMTGFSFSINFPVPYPVVGYVVSLLTVMLIAFTHWNAKLYERLILQQIFVTLLLAAGNVFTVLVLGILVRIIFMRNASPLSWWGVLTWIFLGILTILGKLSTDLFPVLLLFSLDLSDLLTGRISEDGSDTEGIAKFIGIGVTLLCIQDRLTQLGTSPGEGHLAVIWILMGVQVIRRLIDRSYESTLHTLLQAALLVVAGSGSLPEAMRVFFFNVAFCSVTFEILRERRGEARDFAQWLRLLTVLSLIGFPGTLGYFSLKAWVRAFQIGGMNMLHPSVGFAIFGFLLLNCTFRKNFTEGLHVVD